MNENVTSVATVLLTRVVLKRPGVFKLGRFNTRLLIFKEIVQEARRF
jgi:hypothetical protein